MKIARLLTFVCCSLMIIEKPQAFVLPLDFVIKQSISRTGRIPITINQSVTIKAGTESFKVDETWLIEGDRNLKVHAWSTQSNEDNLNSINVHSLFNADRKINVVGKNRISDHTPQDFFQKYLFIRSTESFALYLQALKINSETRLSRADGRVCIAIGRPSEEATKYPQLWIDQDDFLIRKIRLPSGAEIQLSDYVKVGPNFYIAKTQIIKWSGFEAIVKVKNYSIKNKIPFEKFYPQNLTDPTQFSLSPGPLSQVVEDFYKRFR